MIFIIAAVRLRQCRPGFGRSLIDFDRDCELLVAGAVAGSAHRHRAESVKADRDPNVCLGRTNTVDRVKADPAETGHRRFRPGVTAVLLDGIIGAKISGDIARRDREAVGRADEDVRQVAGDAALARKNLNRRRGFLRRVVVMRQLFVQPVHKCVKVREYVVAVCGTGLVGEFADALIGLRQWRVAQEQAWRKPFDGTAYHSLGFCVSTSPSTLMLNVSSGPSAVNTWVRLPKASSCALSRASVDTSDARCTVSTHARLNAHEDAFGNLTHVFTADGPLETLSINVDGEVETQNTEGVVRGTVERFPPSLFLRDTPLTQADERIRKFADENRPANGYDVLAHLHALMHRLHEELPHDHDAPQEAATAVEVFARKRGIARDLTHIFIGAAHSFAIPARYMPNIFRR